MECGGLPPLFRQFRINKFEKGAALLRSSLFRINAIGG
jgi:hypothetical protein